MKRLLLLMMVLTAVLALGACAGGQGDTSTAAGASTTAGTATAETNAGDTGMAASGQAAATGSAAATRSQGQGGPGGPCSNVRCAECPEGQTPALTPPDCCRCVPIDTNLTDCSAVRCAACPEGQHPKLTPPDCCRCVPD